jgi:2-oxoisovalerate dehydrogenase E1 component alpha subunit
VTTENTQQLESMGRTLALEVYRLLRLTRLVDDSLARMQNAGTIGFHIPWRGAEGTAIGAVTALTGKDWIFPSHRYGGVALARGVELAALFHHALGTLDDPSLGRQTPGNFGHADANIVSISSSISARLSQAVGVAHAARLKGEDAVVLAYLGAAATAGNDFHAGLNLAGVLQAPVIYLAERRGTHDAPAEAVAPFGEAYGIESVTVDGGNILAVRAAVELARERIVSGGGPVLIDAPLNGDPFQRYRATLETIGGLSASLLQEMDDSLNEEVEAARQAALTSGPASASTLHDHVLGQVNPTKETILS